MATIAVRGADRSYGDATRVGDRSYGDLCGVARRGAAWFGANRSYGDDDLAQQQRRDAMYSRRSLSADCTVSIAVPLVVSRTTNVVAGDRGNVGGGGSDESPREANLSVSSDRVM